MLFFFLPSLATSSFFSLWRYFREISGLQKANGLATFVYVNLKNRKKQKKTRLTHLKDSLLIHFTHYYQCTRLSLSLTFSILFLYFSSSQTHKYTNIHTKIHSLAHHLLFTTFWFSSRRHLFIYSIERYITHS